MTDVQELLTRLTDRPATPDPVARIATAVRRSRRRRSATGAVGTVAALALALVGFLGTGVLSTTSPRRPPSLSAPAVVLTAAQRLAPARVPCPTQDLRTSARRDPNPTAGASLRMQLTVRNVGSAPCELTNDVFVQLLDEHGLPLRIETGGSDLVRRPPQPALQPGETSTTSLTWTRWCGADPGRWSIRANRTAMPPLLFRTVGDIAPPSCHPRPGSPPYLSAGRWQTLNQYGQPTDNPAEVLTVALRTLTPARRAHPLSYRVTLTNTTDNPVTLPRCPNYIAYVTGTGPVGAGALQAGVNTAFPCAAFGSTLRAGTSFTVDQTINLDGVSKGAHRLAWRLDTITGQPSLEVPLTVTEVPRTTP